MDDRDTFYDNEKYGVIVDFLRGQRPDWEGRWLAEIRTWDFDRLEADHHYIQWLFPLSVESEAVFSPTLRKFEVAELRSEVRLQSEIVASLRQMLGFYGFALHEEGGRLAVLPTDRQGERQSVWMTPGNHNYLRISRILGSLVLVELTKYAAAFLEALEQLYQKPTAASAIDEIAIWYWRRRATLDSSSVLE